MNRAARRQPRLRLVTAMREGTSWRDAVAAAGLAVCRTTAYNCARRVRVSGEAALDDGRHGHPSKFRQPVRDWLVAYCHEHPGAPSRAVQAALQQQFGLAVSRSQINRVRATLGLSRRPQGAGGKYAIPSAGGTA